MVSIANASPGTPNWWLGYLWTKLESELPRLNALFSYQGGAHPLPEGHLRARDAYRVFQRKSRSNYVGLVANSVAERLRPIGFRTGSETTNENDAEAWRHWQANKFDATCPQLLLAAVAASRAYVYVIPNPDDPRTPIWTKRDPRQAITEDDPISGMPVAGLLWHDDLVDGLRHVYVLLPDGVYEWTAKIPRDASKFKVSTFQPVTAPDGTPAVLPNPSAPDIPLVPFVNRPDLEGAGMGEFEDVIDIQDRINSVTLDRLVIGKMQAYRQRFASGVNVEDENGVPQQPFQPGSDLLWIVDDPNAKFGDFAATDLTPILNATKNDVNDLAAITRTPPHYLMGAMVNVSGDALKAAESGLVSKVRDRMLSYGESFEQVMRLSFALVNKTLPVDAELIWANPEYRTLSELYDAASKAGGAGEPWQTRMELLGHTPAEIQRMQQQRVEDALLMAQYPQLEPPGTPVRYAAAAIPADATQNDKPEMTGSAGAAGNGA